MNATMVLNLLVEIIQIAQGTQMYTVLVRRND